MHYQSTLLTTIITAPLLALAHSSSSSIDYDIDNTPQPCQAICRPLADLSRSCDVDNGKMDDDSEDTLQNACFCGYAGFDVAGVASLCQDCVLQNGGNGQKDNDGDDDDNDRHDKRDHDGDDNDKDHDNDNNDNDNDDQQDALNDLDDIFRICKLSPVQTSWSPTNTNASPSSSIIVTATAATDVAQLTTTFLSSPSATAGSGGGSNGGGSSADKNSGEVISDEGKSGSGSVGVSMGLMVGVLGLVAGFA